MKIHETCRSSSVATEMLKFIWKFREKFRGIFFSIFYNCMTGSDGLETSDGHTTRSLNEK